jgi:hypothetical protein
MEDVNRILKETNASLAQAKKLNATAGHQIKQTEKAMGKMNKNMQSSVNRLDKAAQDAVQATIDMVGPDMNFLQHLADNLDSSRRRSTSAGRLTLTHLRSATPSP